jgi:phosphatidylinositol kinase/protein kinase (PI-3  family)
VQEKLEGESAVFQKEMTIEQQVNYVIQQAINEDNLSQLYEGWTAWI